MSALRDNAGAHRYEMDAPEGMSFADYRDIAGVRNARGNVVGLMPHPEAYLYPESHPRWIAQADQGRLPAAGHGLASYIHFVVRQRYARRLR